MLNEKAAGCAVPNFVNQPNYIFWISPIGDGQLTCRPVLLAVSGRPNTFMPSYCSTKHSVLSSYSSLVAFVHQFFLDPSLSYKLPAYIHQPCYYFSFISFPSASYSFLTSVVKAVCYFMSYYCADSTVIDGPVKPKKHCCEGQEKLLSFSSIHSRDTGQVQVIEGRL